MAGNTGSQEAPKGVCPQQLVLELFRTLGDGTMTLSPSVLVRTR